MTIPSGTKLGRYEIRSKIGAGGMGEVYRARDEKLNRDVAIKVLPEAFVQDPDRLVRFKREAQVLASLNHPNIASIYGLEESNGFMALAMELVEGPTLADRLTSGPIAIDDALTIARQIAAALEAAHERGIIHRDIKPANIKVNDDDAVKVLDFGLAKVFVDEAPAADLSHSPTLIRGTQAGMILGTAAYMSPEQAKGKVVDKRSDIWAFGCVLFEMLSGKQSFSGETLTDILASVVRAEPDWNVLPASTPDAIRRLLRRCLTKDQKQRLRDIGEARITIENFQTGKSEEVSETTIRNKPPPLKRTLLWTAAFALAFILGGLAMWLLRPVSSEMPLRKTELQIPGLDLSIYYGYSISPNAKSIAYVSNNRLWIRDLDRLDPREVPNTEDAAHPFWSPDSSYVGYVIGKQMWKASSAGAGSTAIADLPDLFTAAGAASWRADGIIVFTTGSSGLFQVPAQGGDPTPLLSVGTDEDDFHDVSVLPDGRGVLFAVHRSVQGADTLALFDGKSRKNLLRLDGQIIAHPAYSRTGHILFQRRRSNQGIWALPFSLSRLEVTGEPFLVVPGASPPSVADDGTLVFGFGEGGGPTRLVWMDRAGKIVNNIQPEASPFQLPSFRLSPDQKQLVQATRESGKTDYWIVNLARGTRTRLTFDNSPHFWFCGWTPDGNVLYSSLAASAVPTIMLKATNSGGDAKELLKGKEASFSQDGKFIIYGTPDPARGQQGWDIWYVATEPEAKPLPFLVTPKDERYAEFSPDGTYVAYASNESGRYEVYVKPFPNGEGKSRVSIDGGSMPRWSRRGDELFYASGNDIMAVHVQTRPSLVLGQPQKLFSRRPVAADRSEGFYDSYDVSADGQRFVILQSDEGTNTNQKLMVIQNWFAEFKDKQK